MDIKELLTEAQNRQKELIDQFNVIGERIQMMEQERQQLLTKIRQSEGEIKAYTKILDGNEGEKTCEK